MGYYRKYFPAPTFVSVDENGAITLEWCADDKRVLIAYEADSNAEGAPAELYGIYTAKTETERVLSEIIPLATQADVVKLLSETMGLVPEE